MTSNACWQCNGTGQLMQGGSEGTVPCDLCARPPAQGVGVGKLKEVERDAQRYRRLRVMGCAVMDHPNLEEGLVSRFTNLDDIIDADLKTMRSRGEFALATPSSEGDGAAPCDHVAWTADDGSIVCAKCAVPMIRSFEGIVQRWVPATPSQVSPAIGGDGLMPIPFEFATELKERLFSIAADERLRSAHTHLGGEIRRFSSIIECAAKCLGRPISPPDAAPGFSKLCLGGAERSDCETNPNGAALSPQGVQETVGEADLEWLRDVLEEVRITPAQLEIARTKGKPGTLDGWTAHNARLDRILSTLQGKAP